MIALKSKPPIANRREQRGKGPLSIILRPLFHILLIVKNPVIMLQEMYYWLMYFLGKIGKTEMYDSNSYLLISLLAGLNLLTIIMLFAYLFNIDIRNSLSDRNSKTIAIFFALSVVLVNYFYLFKQRKKIVEKYDELSGKRETQGQILFWIYSVLSLVLFFVVGMSLYPYVEK